MHGGGKNMDKGAVVYLARLSIQKGLGVLLYLIGANWVLNERAGIYFCIYIVATMISGIFLYSANTTTLAERNKIKTNSPVWDKILLGLFWLLSYFIIYLIAGFEAKNTDGSMNVVFWLGIVLSLMSGVFTLWAMIANTFLESTARIQSDREQIVCQSGPYSIVRHPAYSSLILWCISICLVFPTIGVVICAIAVAIIIVIRTYLEDEMLKDGLDGYKKYAEKVKHRLIPYIW